ncbi:hypothetical protein ECC02_009709 [Trypanosoma cruzi]|uniref:Uncharacterized protein n=1 Tax=Trypanosoma cruzi TaxID=5693 RepID=A0A7J6XU82_TRYCR|nr:hypothetical protein ECC02_009709 [Trypanosoma cruzi]
MKEHNASKGAKCRHPVRRRHGAFLAMYEAQATKQLSSAIVIASSRFALLFLGASFSAAPTAAATGHAAAAIAPTERQGRVCGSVCREHSDCHRRRRPSCSRVIISAHTKQHTPGSANTFLQSTVQVLMCGRLLEEQKKKEEHREAHQHSKRHSWMAAIHAVRPRHQQSRTVAAHPHPQKNKNKTKEKHGGRVWLCVWRCGWLPALAAIKKQNKRGRNVCSAPQALVARPHVTAPSARRSSRPLLMRAAGEAHRAVVMSVSVGVRVEQLGGKHTAPLTGRVQKKQLKKEGRVEKKKRPQ